MRRIKSRDTVPELLVRRLLHSLGFRFRLHRRDLPGSPDLVFPSRKKVIFVHGCFWHGHDCPRGNRVPKTNQSYWRVKLSRNRERDRRNCEMLRDSGWDPYIVWECETKHMAALSERLSLWLSAATSNPTVTGRHTSGQRFHRAKWRQNGK